MELAIISQKGYCGYYLVVADFIQWSKDNGIRVGPGRGSGAGSIAAYALRITDLCPLEHGLFFERFLNPERPSMPDFDIDFDDHRRGEVIAYVTEKYGADRVAQIATFGRLKSKAAIKDAARVLDHGFAISDRITKALPPDVMGKGVPLKARSSTATTSATPRAASSARCTTPRPTSARSSRPRSASRARSATGACTRPA